MKLFWKETVISAVMGFVVPWVCLSFVVALGGREGTVPVRDPADTGAEEITSTDAQAPEAGMELAVLIDGQVTQMELEEYIAGVVLAEMPAEFETEALKAQAVVARTYALRRMETGNKHDNCDVCGDPNCCQGYKPVEEYLKRGETQENVDKIRGAVSATAGQVLVYDGELIEATYFSCSGGQTEDALTVWGTDIPYLRSTESPGEEDAAHYTDTVFMTREEFITCVDTPLSGPASTWLGPVTYTTGGGVNTIQIGGRTYKGTEVRAMLGLRSTDFTMTAKGDGIEVVTRGFGHRVGMSQYGADAMAVTGSGYREILAHYYQGTDLIHYEP